MRPRNWECWTQKIGMVLMPLRKFHSLVLQPETNTLRSADGRALSSDWFDLMIIRHIKNTKVKAEFSPCQKFRYTLTIDYLPAVGSKTVCAIMQNPCMANEEIADKLPTAIPVLWFALKYQGSFGKTQPHRRSRGAKEERLQHISQSLHSHLRCRNLPTHRGYYGRTERDRGRGKRYRQGSEEDPQKNGGRLVKKKSTNATLNVNAIA